MAAMSELNRLLETLDRALQQRKPPESPAGRGASQASAGLPARRPDAIDVESASERRMTQVISLRESPEVEAFRQALVDGLIRVDTANQLLRLVNTVVTRLLM